jgi:capsular exopolysaccharide synthesis family protein
VELTRYFAILRQRLWMLIACPVVAAIAAGIVSYVIPPVYEAHVSLYVRPVQPIATTDPTVAGATIDQILRTYADWMTQRPVLDGVDRQMQLGLSYDDLLKKVKVTPQANTFLLDVAVQDNNPVRARDIDNQLVNDFITIVGASQPTGQASADNLVVTQPAVTPEKPVFPNKTLNIAIAFAAGLLLAVGLAFLLDYLDQSVKGDDDLIEKLGLIPIGHIAYMPTAKAKRSELVAMDGDSPSAEAYKALRTGLVFSTLDEQRKAIVITSAEAGEGKSRTAANLSIALAQAGHKTLLIDADFRRPSQHRLFGRVRNVGLSNLFLRDASEEEAILVVDTVPNLWLMASGPTPPNPSELLGSARMHELMSKLWARFDYVILDTPPVNAVTDAAVLAASANATMLVVEQGRTTIPALKHAKLMLDRVNAHTIGAVLNKVKATSAGYYYDYRYSSSPNGHTPNGETPKAEEPVESETKTRKQA